MLTTVCDHYVSEHYGETLTLEAMSVTMLRICLVPNKQGHMNIQRVDLPFPPIFGEPPRYFDANRVVSVGTHRASMKGKRVWDGYCLT